MNKNKKSCFILVIFHIFAITFSVKEKAFAFYSAYRNLENFITPQSKDSEDAHALIYGRGFLLTYWCRAFQSLCVMSK